MRLKSIELSGFKSFPEKTAVTFRPGITSIVGPNGTGKSNLTDAILWVFGEQGVKALRGTRMEDVIFNGTDTRRPVGMAEVHLTLTDLRGELPPEFSDYHEVTLTRRLFRSGESEYLINKVPCRLKDIRGLLLSAGTGTKGHAIIEQGKVDEILLSSPVDRRAIVEETAGIARFRMQRAEALRKLEATEQNLTRVRDIIREVSRQMTSLDRQREKALEYEKLMEEIKETEIHLATDEYRALTRALEAVEKECRDVEMTVIQEKSLLSRSEAQQEKKKAALLSLQTDISDLRQVVFEKEKEIHRSEAGIEMLAQQSSIWEELTGRLLQELEEVKKAREAVRQERVSLEKSAGAIEGEQKKKVARLTEKQEALKAREEALSRHLLSVEQKKAALFSGTAELSSARNAIQGFTTDRADLSRRWEKLRGEDGQASSALEQARTAVKGRETHVKDLTQQLSAKRTEFAELLTTREVLQRSVATTEEALSRKREEMMAAKARLLSLEEHDREASHGKAVSGLLADRLSHGALSGLHCPVADILEVPPHLEQAIESVLGERLQALIMEDHQDIQAAIALLKEKELGRGVFVPLLPRRDGTGGVKGSAKGVKGVIGQAVEMVRCREGYETVASSLLEGVLIVQDLETALRLWEGGACPEILVTQEGEVIHPSGAVAGGVSREDGQGLFRKRREIRDLRETVAQCEADVAALEEKRADEKGRLSAVTDQHGEVDSALRRMELELLDHEKGLEAEKMAVGRFSEQREILQEEQDEAGREEERLTEALSRAETTLQTLMTKVAGHEQEMPSLEEKSRQLTADVDVLRKDATGLTVEIATLQERQEQVAATLSRLVVQEGDLEKSGADKETALHGLKGKKASAIEERKKMETAIRRIAAERETELKKVTDREQGRSHEEEALARLGEEIAQRRQTLQALATRAKDAEVKKTETTLRMEHLRDTILASYQVSLHEAASQDRIQAPQRNGWSPEAAQQRLHTDREKLKRMGPVNLAAIEEHKELSERHAFLAGQEADLTRSMEDLRQAIKEINRTTKERFLTTLSAINERFQEVFVSFFGGGKAQLVLLDEDSPLDSGLDIIVQLPGKKVGSLSLLSGGEKTLTAIALLFGSFLVQPGPFCVLDEIDAALDEENIRRFTRVLKTLAEDSQFIIVTHNKRTMEAAGILYGVTMEEPGVSKLLSVRLQETPPHEQVPA